MSVTQSVPVLLHEVPFSPETLSSSVLHIDATNQHSSLFSPSKKRTFDEISGFDEESYARKHLASEAAVFFRKKEHNPRSILWRLLNDRQTLELQSVDLVRTKHEESCMTFEILLPDAVIPNGVVLADTETSGTLEVFALTTSNDLYNVTLKRDLLLKAVPPKEFDQTTCIQKHSLSSLTFRRPYKLVATSATELLISVQDGGMIRLDRDSPSHSSPWRETYYSEGGWTGTLRGLIPLKRHQTVRYGDIELEPSAVVALATSPDREHIWTITLDHELAAWSTRTGKVVARRDLMGLRQDADSKRQYIMPAEQGSLLKIFDQDTGEDLSADQMQLTTRQYQIMAYSPKERAFKLFSASAGSESSEPPRLQDVMQGDRLTLPFDELLNTNLWRCTDYQCKVDAQWHTLQLWTQIQCGSASKVFTITLDLLDDGELVQGWQNKWQTGWSLVAESGPRNSTDVPELAVDDSTSPSQRWLEYLSYPGRYSLATLETALSMYLKIRKLQTPSSKEPLEDRLCAAVSAKIIHSRDRADYAAYYQSIQEQWQALHSVVLDLHEKRMDVKSFAVDLEHDQAWVVRADFVSPTRAVDELERLSLNAELEADEDRFDRLDQSLRESVVTTDHDWEHMRLLSAVSGFSESLPASFKQTFAEKAAQEAHQHGISIERAQAFFESTDVGRYVSDDAYQSLELALQPLNGIGALTTNTFTALINAVTGTSQKGVKSNWSLNRYGTKFMIASGQQLIRQEKQLLLGLLALVIFINNDFESDGLDQEFSAVELYHDITAKLRHTNLLDWLTRTIVADQDDRQTMLSTVFDTMFFHGWDSHAPKSLTFPEKLTHWCRQWIFKTMEWHDFTAGIYSILLKRRMYDEASRFECFLQPSAWTTYLRARLHLAIGEHEEAAVGFERAAKGLSAPLKGEIDSAKFLRDDERNLFGQGPEQYYLHVANLFEHLKLYASTVDFAQRAMSFIKEARFEKDLEAIDAKKNSALSPAETVANARAEVQLLQKQTTWEELVTRCFNALVQTGRYNEAYAVLLKFKAADLRRSNLQKLIDNCARNDMLSSVLQLPFDDEAAVIADGLLLKLAQKTAPTSTTLQPTQRILYAFRTQRGQYRAAAQILYEYLERLRHLKKDSRLHHPDDETILQAYLMLINTLACCGEGEEWLLADPIPGVHAENTRRKLLTLDEVRRDYVAELDRRSDLQHGRFPLISNDEDEEMENV